MTWRSATATYKPGGVSTMTYPGGRVLTYEMDAVGRTAKLRSGASDYFVSAASYAAHGLDPDVRRGPWCVVAAWAAN